ncbi:MAG: M15 family metallopeptidase [Eubacteriales bacterium]|nr:M15 family metallopeptidase [Eubacteriales bacterium]
MIKKKLNLGMILMSVAGLLFLIILIGLMLFCLNLNSKCVKLEKSNAQYQKENEEKQKEIDGLKAQMKELNEQIIEKDAELMQQSTEEGQATIAPSRGSSSFSHQQLTPGAVLSEQEVSGNYDVYFQEQVIERGDEVFQRIMGKSYQDNDHIGLDQLRYLKLIHYNFNHEIQVGEMIVNAALAQEILSIFKELFMNEYEIQSVFLIDNYWQPGMTGDEADTASIDQNNTSCFNYRPVTGGSTLSDHAYGRAIDINPQQNPYINAAGGYSHTNAAPYIDRSSGLPHMITDGDVCDTIFEKYGFSWGGLWTGPIDYQHFYKKAN